jgi:hypothetical protein
MIEAAKVDQGAYAKLLATVDGGLVCANEADRITCCAGYCGRLNAGSGKAHHQPGMPCLGGADGRRQNRDRGSGEDGGCFVQVPLIGGDPGDAARLITATSSTASNSGGTKTDRADRRDDPEAEILHQQSASPVTPLAPRG